MANPMEDFDFAAYNQQAFENALLQQTDYTMDIDTTNMFPTEPMLEDNINVWHPNVEVNQPGVQINQPGSNQSNIAGPSGSQHLPVSGRVRPSPTPNRGGVNRSRYKRTKVMRTVPVPGPLSELTKHSNIPLGDTHGFVNRSAEVRMQEAAKRKGFIRRPMNSFMLYRSAYAERTKEWCHENHHQIVSTVIGTSWAMEPEHLRTQFMLWADMDKHNHADAFPNYKYQPRRSPRGAETDDEHPTDSDNTGAGDSEYVPSRAERRKSTRKQRQRRGPPAPQAAWTNYQPGNFSAVPQQTQAPQLNPAQHGGLQHQVPTGGLQHQVPTGGLQHQAPTGGLQHQVPTGGSQYQVITGSSYRPVNPDGTVPRPFLADEWGNVYELSRKHIRLHSSPKSHYGVLGGQPASQPGQQGVAGQPIINHEQQPVTGQVAIPEVTAPAPYYGVPGGQPASQPGQQGVTDQPITNPEQQPVTGQVEIPAVTTPDRLEFEALLATHGLEAMQFNSQQLTAWDPSAADMQFIDPSLRASIADDVALQFSDQSLTRPDICGAYGNAMNIHRSPDQSPVRESM